MKAKNILLIVGGIVQVLFLALHVSIFFSLAANPDLDDKFKQTATTFNVTLTTTLLFFAYVSLLRRQDLLGAGLGQSVCIFVALFYVLLGLADVVVSGLDLGKLGLMLIVAAPYAIVALLPQPVAQVAIS